MLSQPLICVDQLVERTKTPGVKILDASWRMPGTPGVSAIEAFRQRHIPGARFFDIDAISDQASALPHMLPTPEFFAQTMGAMGISNDDDVVVYDDAGIFSSPRVWWTFRAMGHENVAVLNGGLPAWVKAGCALSNDLEAPSPQHYKASPQNQVVEDDRAVFRSIGAIGPVVIDARSAARFHGEVSEPRAGLKSGHMPSAVNVPFDDLITDDGRMKPASALSQIFGKAGIAADTKVITSCGSGITAAVIALALEVIGHRQWSLYDGSWAEWGLERNAPHLFPVIKKDG